MTLVQFVENIIGTVPTEYEFVIYCVSAVLLVSFIAIFLRFLLGAISGIFYH
jgi:hypothetical protein